MPDPAMPDPAASRPQPAPVLSVRDLGISFGSHRPVERISFDIHAGEPLALVGESG